MRLWKRIGSLIKGIKTSSRRFPITIGISSFLFLLLIYFNEKVIDLPIEIQEDFIRFNMLVGLGIPLSLGIGLLYERYFTNNRVKKILGYLFGFLILIVYKKLWLYEINYLSIARYLGSMLFLLISIFYISRLAINDDYENYLVNIFSSILITAVYSFVLTIGIFGIIFTIDKLFDVLVKGKYYYYIFLFNSLVFSLAFFLSKLPAALEGFHEYKYSLSLRVLLTYIIIPLICVYTIILYLYFIKVLLQWEWPKGLISHLVLWYSIIATGTILLINPLTNENKVCRLFKKYFPKVLLPILGMMFLSIGQRVNQYGITENRYFIIVLGIWVGGIMVYFSVGKKPKTIVIPITLSFLIFNAVFGPLSSFACSKYSQNKRFEKILSTNKMLDGKEIVVNPTLNDEDKEEITSIINYFITKHSLRNINILDTGFKIEDMEEVFGFSYEGINYSNPIEYFYFSQNEKLGSILIDEYDYYLEINSLGDKQSIDIDGISLIQSKEVLQFMEDGQNLLLVDINDFISLDKLRTNDITNKGQPMSLDEMSFVSENDKIKVNIIFNYISGEFNINTKEIKVENADFVAFIKIKK